MSIEAMKQALEALEMYILETNSQFQREAITSLRQAIAEAEKQEWVGLTKEDKQKLAAEQHGWEGLCSAVEAKLKQKNGYAEEKNT